MFVLFYSKHGKIFSAVVVILRCKHECKHQINIEERIMCLIYDDILGVLFMMIFWMSYL